ncbi:colicin E3/pyocin S6 family cytotoxin [Streptomyces marianii]
MRKRWKDPKGDLDEWDSRHGAVEKYNKRGKQQSSLGRPANRPARRPVS